MIPPNSDPNKIFFSNRSTSFSSEDAGVKDVLFIMFSYAWFQCIMWGMLQKANPLKPNNCEHFILLEKHFIIIASYDIIQANPIVMIEFVHSRLYTRVKIFHSVGMCMSRRQVTYQLTEEMSIMLTWLSYFAPCVSYRSHLYEIGYALPAPRWRHVKS